VNPPDLIAEPSSGVPEEKSNHMLLIVLILSSVALAALAQLTLKHGMNQVAANTGELKLHLASLRDVFTTPAVWGGLLLFGLSALVWLAVLSRTSLSFAYPFAALTYVLILLFDRLVLKEPVMPLRWLGVALIIGGLIFVSRTGEHRAEPQAKGPPSAAAKR
jgi:drug/metabolite transporter (DMT)-like permease